MDRAIKIANLFSTIAIVVFVIFMFSGTEYRLTFLSYTVICWIAVASFVKMLHIAIQPTMIFGGWQNWLNKFDEKGLTVLYKWLGGCEICTSSFFSFLSIALYLGFMYQVDAWIITGWVWNIIWLIMYWSVGTMTNLYFMVKLLEKKQPQ